VETLYRTRYSGFTAKQIVSRVVVYLDGSKPLAKRAFDCAVASERLAVAIGGSRVRVGLRTSTQPRNRR